MSNIGFPGYRQVAGRDAPLGPAGPSGGAGAAAGVRPDAGSRGGAVGAVRAPPFASLAQGCRGRSSAGGNSLGMIHTLFASPWAIWGSVCRYW